MLEFSFCKCSQIYLDSLCRTFSSHPELAIIVNELYVDMRAICRLNDTTSDDQIKPARSFNVRRQILERMQAFLGHDGRRDSSAVAFLGHDGHRDSSAVVASADSKAWNFHALQVLKSPQLDEIFSFLPNVRKVTVS